MAGELTVYDPGLPNMPGWTSLSDAEQKWLQEKTSNLLTAAANEGIAALKGAVELFDIREGLKGKKGLITNYVNTIYKKSPSNGWTRLKAVDEIIANGWKIEAIRAIATQGSLMRGAIGINLGEIAIVSKQLQAPRDLSAKSVETFVEHRLRPALRDRRSEKAKRKAVKLTDESIPPLMFNSARLIMDKAKNMTSNERKHILKTVVSCLMQHFGVPGEIRCVRAQVPEGWIRKVGYPRGKKRTKPV